MINAGALLWHTADTEMVLHVAVLGGGTNENETRS
jgi:hypothetical protein